MPRRLSAAQIASFKVDGFLPVHDVVSAADVAELADYADRVAAGNVSHIPAERVQLERPFRRGEEPVLDRVLSVRKLSAIACRDEVFWRHACHPAIVDMVADLLGTDDLKLYSDQLFMKGPRTGSEQPWHQDSASWRDIFPMDLVTAWTAMDEATSQNGCLNFAAGTHRWGMVRKERLEPFIDQLGSAPWPVTEVPLRPGDVSFHHSLVLHRSGPTAPAPGAGGTPCTTCAPARGVTYRSMTLPRCRRSGRSGAGRSRAGCSRRSAYSRPSSLIAARNSAIVCRAPPTT